MFAQQYKLAEREIVLVYSLVYFPSIFSLVYSWTPAAESSTHYVLSRYLWNWKINHKNKVSLKSILQGQAQLTGQCTFLGISHKDIF